MFEEVYSKMLPFWNNITENERKQICENSLAVTYRKGSVIHDGSECSGVFFYTLGLS